LGSFGTSAEPATSHPSHDTWVAKDQQVLGFINASLSREILSHVATCTSAAAVWRELQVMFTSQSRACTIQLHTRLVTTQKCVLSAAVYYNKMKGFADGMVAAGKPLEDDDFISYVLVRLDHDYNSSVGNVTSKTNISLGTLYSLFLVAEARLDPQSSQYQSSANVAMHDRALQ
jgi:hypothetical protein